MEIIEGSIVVKFKDTISKEFADQFVDYLGYEKLDRSKETSEAIYRKFKQITIIVPRHEKKKALEELKKYDKFIDSTHDPDDDLAFW